MICDIVFTDNDYTEDGLFPSNWKPIEFKGVFDGQGYKISNLKIIVRNSLEYQWYNPGLFSLNDGTIKNLTIEKMQITVGQCGGRYGGFITAENNGVISNCHSKGCTIILENVSHYFGGIVGNNTGIIQKCTSDNIVNWNPIGGRIGGISANNSGSIRNCINKTTITNTSNSCFPISGGITAQNSGTISFSKNLSTISANSIESQITARCGGIAGEMTGGEIKQCYNSGNVNATATKYKSYTYSGGMVAYISGGKINDCYNIADIYGESKSSSASSYVGGLIGYNSTRGTIKNCYAVGNNSGKASSNNLYVGYICGYNSTNTIDNCYYLGIENNGSGFGDISTQYGNNSLNLQDKNTYSEFDFNKIWTITVDKNYSYPQLKLLPMDYNNEDSTIIITGDINGDENINVVDIVRLKKFLADMDYCVSSSADLNDDGKINSLDLTILRSLILGINT